MASLTINISTNMPNDALTAEIVNSNYSGQKIGHGIKNLITAITGGAYDYKMDLQSSATSKAAASGSIAITHANVTNGDTVTIGGVVITAATSGNGTSSWTIGANATADATAMAACINANTTLSKHITASASNGTVTLTAKLEGSIGNLIVMSTSDATAFALTQMTGGAGGPEGTVVSVNNTSSIS